MKKFIAFDKRKNQNHEKFNLILGIDKKEMNSLQTRKQFYFNLTEMNTKYLLQKYFRSIVQYGFVRRKNKAKAKYLENIINSRSAICFLKLWFIKSEKRREFYKKIAAATSKIKFFMRKKLFKKSCGNMKEICEFQKKEDKANNFFKKTKKEKIIKILSILLKKKQRNNRSQKFCAINLKYKIFELWKGAFAVRREKMLKNTKAFRFSSLNLKRKLIIFTKVILKIFFLDSFSQ